MTIATTLWCEHALLPDGIADRVLVTIDDGRITAVERGVDPPAGAIRRRGVTLPGAANAHSHAFHRTLRHRSQSGSGSFWTWRDEMYSVAAALDPESYHRLARAVFAEMVLAGYTGVGEFHYLHHGLDGTPYAEADAMGDALVAAADAAGLRITLLDTLYLHGGLDHDGYRTLDGVQRRFGDDSIDGWAARIASRRSGDRARRGAAIHSVRAVDPGTIAAAATWVDETGLPLHAHLSEQPAENEACLAHHGATPTQVFESAGASSTHFTAVHATHLTDGDVALLGRSGAGVCLCPTTERDLGDGIGPARRLLDAGVALSIGSDSHAVIDPFEEARAIELDERLVRGARGVVSTGELTRTLHAGHTALGWSECGSVAVGSAADLATVTLDSPRTAGARPSAVAAAIGVGATAADVTHVMIDGVEVVTDGAHRTIDVAAELTAAIAAVTRR